MFQEFQRRSIHQGVTNTKWLDIYISEDVNEASESVTKKLTNILNNLAPLKTFQVRKNYCDWMSQESKTLIKKRNEAQRYACLTQKDEDWNSYKRLRNQVTNRLKYEKCNSSRRKLAECSSNSKNTWKVVKSILSWSSSGPPNQLVYEGALLTKPAELSETMNKFFIDKVAKLRQNLPNSTGDPLDLVKRLMNGVECKFSFKAVSPDQVDAIISKMNNSGACGVDEINIRILKMGKEQLIPALTHIVNLSISSGCFPLHWKCAKIIPLHKKEDRSNPKNYRPVALLPVIVERAVFLQFMEYLEGNNIMNPSHHGFHSSHSICTALLEMYDAWTEAQEDGKISATIMLDLSSAFDVVDFSILLQKMKLYGFDEQSINWLSSYLTDRSQKVLIDGHLSSPLPITIGVPQGSIMAPLLYLIYTNDLTEAVHNHTPEVPHEQYDGPNFNIECNDCGRMCLYADDSTYTASNEDSKALKENIDARYQNIVQYMANNKLVLNTDKTHLLIMASKKQHRQHGDFDISLNTGFEVIQPSSNEKLLGATISNDMEWNLHIQGLQKNLCTRLNALSKVCSIADFSTRKLIANGIFMSSLVSLIQLWSGTSEFYLNMLQVAQNRAARLVTKLPLTTNTETLLRQVGWLSVRQLCMYHSLMMVYKIRTTGRPTYYARKFKRCFPRVTRYASGNSIHIQGRITTNIRKQNFAYRAAQNWNSLPSDIRLTDKLCVFQRRLKIWVKDNVSR